MQHSFSWRSQVLRDQRVNGVSRAVEIIDELRSSDSALREEMFQALGNVSQNLDASFWSRYFRAYDKLVSYNPSYRELLELSHEHLPTAGTILDLGAGTGNFSLDLHLKAPKRRFSLVDSSRESLTLAAAKFKARANQVPTLLERLLVDQAPFPAAEGAVMNSHLHTIAKWSDKRDLLARVAASLPKQGEFLLNEPLPDSGDPSVYRESFLHGAAAAIVQESPMTEFDLAVLAAANLPLGRAESKGEHSSFLSYEEMEQLCSDVGFVVEDTRETYNGITRAYLLRKG